MKSILVLFAHPALENSRVNRAWLEAIRELPGVTVHDLYEEYPEFDVDVRREQTLLEKHDIVVLQHPLYWYSAPALVKQWLDLVLEHGWAYGAEGNALEGKKLLSAVTTGAKREAYSREGFHETTMDEILVPFRRTAVLCKMEYLKPYVGYGSLMASPEAVMKGALGYAEHLLSLHRGEDDGGES